MTTHSRPWVGDEVLADDDVRAIVTDVRDGVLWLRASGREDWPAQDPKLLTVTRRREERAAAGEP